MQSDVFHLARHLISAFYGRNGSIPVDGWTMYIRGKRSGTEGWYRVPEIESIFITKDASGGVCVRITARPFDASLLDSCNLLSVVSPVGACLSRSEIYVGSISLGEKLSVVQELRFTRR